MPPSRSHFRPWNPLPRIVLAATTWAAAACGSSFDTQVDLPQDRPLSSCALTWNLNGGVQPGAGATLASTLALLPRLPQCELMVFTEVQPEWAYDIEQTLLGNQPSLAFHLGSSGVQQRMLLAWDTRRYQSGAPEEVQLSGTDGRGRAPILLPLRDRVTDMELLVTAVHLRASDNEQLDLEFEALTTLLAGRQTNQLLMGDLNAGCTTGTVGSVAQCAPSLVRFVQDTPLSFLSAAPQRSTLCGYAASGPTPDMLLVSPGWVDSVVQATELDDVDWCSTMGSGAHRPLGYRFTYSNAAP